jgi:hypothetical protein
MQFRARHFASFLLLLASLGAAEGSTLRDGTPAFGAHYIAVLLAHQDAARSARIALTPATESQIELALTPTGRAQHKTAWTVRPPAAQSIAVHGVTGSSL